ncbi:arylsulfatase [Colwellia sp. UCD-KL20]|uniref:sulfatase family protein n=1 Tax=Colwellia sp. UCD-KL20 TaxID=1917165 RepID=UPI00097137C8|nr:arylsulfatase [Colwellia sp. UCD-KL20]
MNIKPFVKMIIPLSIITLLPACQQTTQETANTSKNPDKPNIVVFYVDDLGWGDVSSYGATRVTTPNIDKLAENGIKFTDAHSSSATCTPSRYSLLTGEYAFRKNARILKGDAPLLIGTDQPTLPKLLKNVGYKSGVVGKWHLGLGDGKQPIDWNGKVSPGPLEIGFDYSFLLPATGDRVPTVYLENHHVLNLSKDDPLFVSYKEKIGNRPTGDDNPELLRQVADPQHNKTIINGVSRIGWMQGGKSAEWKDEDFPLVTTQKANTFISANQNNPFFLFFSFHDIHVPRLPHPMFQGATDMGNRGDAIVQMDWITGQVVDHLKKLNLFNNTLIIFTSDNGAVLFDGYEDGALSLTGSHKQNGIYRGGKFSAFEAGTRVPFIVHYPNKVKAGTSHALMSQIDLYASIASMLNLDLSNTEAIDSKNHLAALFNANTSARTTLIEETPFTLALREGDWKYIQPARRLSPKLKTHKKIEGGLSKQSQLYDLSIDPSETTNIANKKSARVKRMNSILEDIKQQKTRED